jgi:hypothetical protein
MALAVNEVWERGFVVDATNDRTAVVTYSKAGATRQAGFLRDPDGRLVVTNG